MVGVMADSRFHGIGHDSYQFDGSDWSHRCEVIKIPQGLLPLCTTWVNIVVIAKAATAAVSTKVTVETPASIMYVT